MITTTYSAKVMVADVVRKYKHLEETRLAALADKDAKAYTKARAQQDVLADLLDKWDVSIDDAGVDYTRQSWDEVKPLWGTGAAAPVLTPRAADTVR